MEITEVRVKLMEDSDDRLQAFCSITLDDCFVIRDLKIIDGSNGPFVAMPSRKLTSHCPQCNCKNHLRAAHCNQCGTRLNADRGYRDQEGRSKLYADIAHPINSQCREMIQDRVIREYEAELQRAQEPGYVSRYDEDYEDVLQGPHGRAKNPAAAPPPADEDSGVARVVHEAENVPRPPHQPRPESAAEKASTNRDEDDFGAGIF